MADQDNKIFQFFNEIGIIEQLARNRLERRLPHGLKISQFSVLNHFVRLGGEQSPAQLASAFQVTKGAMTNTLNRLSALGLIRVSPNATDGRAKVVQISKKGIRVHTQSLHAMSGDLRAIEGSLGTPSFESALPFLVKVREYLDQTR